MKEEFQIVLINIINLFKFNSVENIIKFILFVFLIVVASIVIHLVYRFITLSIERKETENTKHKNELTKEYFIGYIKGVGAWEELKKKGCCDSLRDENDKNIEKCPVKENCLKFLQGFKDGYKDLKTKENRK